MKRILYGNITNYTHQPGITLNLRDCTVFDAKRLEEILGKAVGRSTPNITPLGWEEDTEYLTEWCLGPGWSQSFAHVYGSRYDAHSSFSSLELQAFLPQQDLLFLVGEIEKKYEIQERR